MARVYARKQLTRLHLFSVIFVSKLNRLPWQLHGESSRTRVYYFLGIFFLFLVHSRFGSFQRRTTAQNIFHFDFVFFISFCHLKEFWACIIWSFMIFNVFDHHVDDARRKTTNDFHDFHRSFLCVCLTNARESSNDCLLKFPTLSKYYFVSIASMCRFRNFFSRFHRFNKNAINFFVYFVSVTRRSSIAANFDVWIFSHSFVYVIST